MSSGTLRIAITADPELPVPPRQYGGIERVIHFLVEGLSARGHEVVLFAHPDSHTSCELVPYRGSTSGSSIDLVCNSSAIVRRLHSGKFDVIHAFGRLAYLAPLAYHPVRKIMSYQRAIRPRSIVFARRLFGRSIEFTACSRHMTRSVESLATWHTVYNGVPVDTFTFTDSVAPDAPLVFLGRLEEIKGPHLAIQAARAASRRIVLAGNLEKEHRQFFDRHIRPHVDGSAVEYIGPVNDCEKNQLLGGAAALLMPILWDEPFGIVMAEALACGTPVIGFPRASVPEVVADGVTGLLANDVAGMVAAIERLSEIDRRSCRVAAETRFSDRVIVAAYEALYRREPHFALAPVTASSLS
jgi:glycosyltransferase involved in cell wall biosynthesis